MNHKRFIYFFGLKFGGLELKKSMSCLPVIFLVELRNGGNEYTDSRDRSFSPENMLSPIWSQDFAQLFPLTGTFLYLPLYFATSFSSLRSQPQCH